MINRYVLFGFDTYYPGGGINDMLGSFETYDAALDYAMESSWQHYQVLDLETGGVAFING